MKKVFQTLTIALVLAAVMFVATACGRGPDTKISLKSGDYIGEQIVTLTADGGNTDGVEFYYTLDDSEPTKSSIQYDKDKKIYLNYDCTLKARSYVNGSYGAVAEEKYKIKESKDTSFSSNDRGLLQNIRGSYATEDGKNTITILSAEKVISFNIDGKKATERPFDLETPEGDAGAHGLTGTIITQNDNGEEVKIKVKMEDSYTDEVYFNDVKYIYQG